MEHRYSRQRESVLVALRATKEHPDAETIYNTVRKTLPNISLGTVYRNLGELVELGDATTVETGDNRVHFDADTVSHQHFVCKTCGRILDINIELSELSTLKSPHRIERASVVLYGECDSCTAPKNAI